MAVTEVMPLAHELCAWLNDEHATTPFRYAPARLSLNRSQINALGAKMIALGEITEIPGDPYVWVAN